LPDGWPVRVFAGLQALAEVEEGTLLVRPDTVRVTGVTGSLESRGRITQILSGQLGPGQTFRVDVRYDEALDPIASLPTPEECVADVNRVISRTKITFTPASAEIATSARPVLDELAAILVACPPMQLEIAGHTDAQGSEGGNKALSQARAEAVLLALQGRRVDISGMTAEGYGEATPIADNKTEDGRETNRRIEFVLKGVHGGADAGATDMAATDMAATGQAAAGPDIAAGAVPAGSSAPSANPAPETQTTPAVIPAEEEAGPAAEPVAEAAAAPATPDAATPATGAEPVTASRAAPDFSGDTSPSVAPTEKTIRPLSRPEGTSAEGTP
jgi:OOP family OmpA-OmpF porin